MFTILCYDTIYSEKIWEKGYFMKLKRILIITLCILTFSSLSLTGCTSQNNDTEDTTAESFTMDNSIYPENYGEIQEQIFSIIGSPKEKKDGKTVGSNCMRLINKYDDFESPELLKEIKKEAITEVNNQVKGVDCTDVKLVINPKDKTDGLFYIYFTYVETGYEDMKIYHFDLT